MACRRKRSARVEGATGPCRAVPVGRHDIEITLGVHAIDSLGIGRAFLYQEADRLTLIDTGLAVSGPNCLGNLAAAGSLVTMPDDRPQVLERGPVAIVGQSGGLAMAIKRTLEERGINTGYVVTSGNEAGLTTADYIRFFTADEDTKVIVSYLEAIHDRGAVPSRSIEPDVLEAVRCHVRLQQIEHRRPLREHERFVPFGCRGLERFEQKLGLRRGLRMLARHQGRVTRGLAQAQQSLERGERVSLALKRSESISPRRKTHRVIHASFILVELRAQRDLGSRRKLRRHHALEPSQEKWPNALS